MLPSPLSLLHIALLKGKWPWTVEVNVFIFFVYTVCVYWRKRMLCVLVMKMTKGLIHIYWYENVPCHMLYILHHLQCVIFTTEVPYFSPFCLTFVSLLNFFSVCEHTAQEHCAICTLSPILPVHPVNVQFYIVSVLYFYASKLPKWSFEAVAKCEL